MADNAEIFDAHGRRCAACGQRAHSAHHRIHGDRSDRRFSNLLPVCGSGTTGHHGWIEAHFRRAQRLGWTVSKFGADPADVPAFLAFGIYGPGWYLLSDEDGGTMRRLTPEEEGERGLLPGTLALNCTCERDPDGDHDAGCAARLVRAGG